MKKLLELLGTILVTSNAVGSLIVSKPNKNKIKNNLQTLNLQKRQIFIDLHFAIHENDLNKVKILLAQQIDVNVEDEHGWIPLLIAIKNNNLNIVQELLTNENSKDKININIKNKFSQTLLHLAAQENNTEIAKLLLINNANINVINNKGQTPLHLAVQNGNLAMVKLLLDYGVASDAVDKEGNTALVLAEKRKYLNIKNLLVENNNNSSYVSANSGLSLDIEKRQTTTTNNNQDVEPKFIEKEITLDKNYSENIQKILQELKDEKYINPLRSFNMGGLISTEIDNETIIDKLKELEPKIAAWFKDQKVNKEKILILTVKNNGNQIIKLVIKLENFYVLGFINNQNQYFYFDDQLVKREKEKNKNQIDILKNLKTDLENFNNLTKENQKDNTEKEELEWKIKEELSKLKEQLKNKINPEKIKNIDKLIKEEINKAKELKELNEAKKGKSTEKINEITKKIENLKIEIFIFIPAINYTNDKKYLNNKIEKLQGENLKKDEEKLKVINSKVAEKYKSEMINLEYTGAYTSDGLNIVIKQNGKPEGKNIYISQDTLTSGIKNLSEADSDNMQHQNIKDDLARMIFITSEAIRFQFDEKKLDIFAEIKNINELKKIMAESQNILEDIQEKIFNKNWRINWKSYTSQLRGDWKKYSEQFNKFRKEIWNNLIRIKNLVNFIFKNKIKEELKKDEFLNKILATAQQSEIEQELKNLFDKNSDENENTDQNLKNDFVKEVSNFIKIQKNPLKLDTWNSLSSNFSSEQNIINKQQEILQRNSEKLNLENKIEKSNEEVKNNIIKIINNFNNDDTSFLSLFLFTKEKKLDMIRLLIIILNQNPAAINGYFANLSLLHYAAFFGYTKIVELLLSHKKIDVNGVDKNGFTPLHLAVLNGKDDVIKLLFDKAQELYKDKPEELEKFINSKTNQDSSNDGNADNSNSRVSVGDRPGTSGTQRQNTYSGSGGKIFVDDGSKIIGIENNYSKQDNKNIYDVSGDGSCLFWSVAMAYLLPVRNNNEEFKNRFMKLFGTLQLSYLSYMQNSLQQFDLTNHSSIQGLYQDATANRLIRGVFRNLVVDYIERNLDQPTQINLDGSQSETFRRVINLSENYFVNTYLQRMRNINTWGGQIEILAIGNMLNVNINESNQNIFSINNSNENIQIFHVESKSGSGVKNHYNFRLSQQYSINSNATNITADNKLKQNDNDLTITTLKPVPVDNFSNSTAITKAVDKYNTFLTETKQQKLNEINQHYQSLPEDEKKVLNIS